MQRCLCVEAKSRCKTVQSIFNTDCLSLSLLSFLTSYKLSNVNALFFFMGSKKEYLWSSSPSFGAHHLSVKSCLTVSVQVDRTVLEWLVASYVAGREVNMRQILEHEPMPIPISLAETIEAFRIGSKASLVDCLTSDVQCPVSINVQGNWCLLIDGQAMVIAIGKQQTCKTFGDFADAFVNRMISVSDSYDSVDVVFDVFVLQTYKTCSW